ncbi:hypothetical protein ASD80_18125 [Devosia sp. Root635]|nr:hypothetical protein ASD80_18125 [Devosia sp. Root635]
MMPEGQMFIAPSPLRGGPGRGWFSESPMDPHPHSLPSRGREAPEPMTLFAAEIVQRLRKEFF